MRHPKLLAALALCAEATVASSAHASSAGDQKPEAGRQSPNSKPVDATQLQEIVVTAQRRNQKLEDVPIAITAVTATQMKARGVSDAFDLSKMTPSFNTNREVGFGTPFMRGVGSTDVSAGDEPSVATYVDGFYQGLDIAAQLPFNNIERVEVLKGPQGTLYGRNAVGGLVSIVTRTPGATPSVEGAVGYGNYDTVSGSLYATGALTDRVDADIAFTGQNQGEGYSRDLLTGKTFGRNSYAAVRSKVLIDLGGSNSLMIGVAYANSKNDIANVNSPLPGTTPLLAGPGVIYGVRPYEFAGNISPLFNVEQYDVNATLRLDLGFANFVSLTQYRHLHSLNQVEGDGTSADGLLFGFQNDGTGTPQLVAPLSFTYHSVQDIPYFTTQEFQLVSKAGGPLTWIMGAYAQADQDGYQPLTLNYSQTAPPVATITRYQRTLALAGYGQATYAFDNGLSLTGGVRFSDERKSVGGEIIEPGVGDFGGAQSEWFSAFTYHVAAEYRFNPGLMAYVTTNRGFKSGLFDVQTPGAPAVRPEALTSYEVGFKADPSRSLRIDASAYYYDYKNLQTFLSAPGGLTLLQNAGGAQMYGAELEFEAAPVAGLNLHGGIGLEHAAYTDFPAAQVYFPSTSGGNYDTNDDVSGKQVVRTPKVTANFGATYIYNLEDRGDLTFNANVAYTGNYYWDLANYFQEKDYALVDLSAKYTTANGRYSLTLWGKNVAGEKYFIYVNPQQRYTAAAYGDPPTFGATLGFRF